MPIQKGPSRPAPTSKVTGVLSSADRLKDDATFEDVQGAIARDVHLQASCSKSLREFAAIIAGRDAIPPVGGTTFNDIFADALAAVRLATELLTDSAVEHKEASTRYEELLEGDEGLGNLEEVITSWADIGTGAGAPALLAALVNLSIAERFRHVEDGEAESRCVMLEDELLPKVVERLAAVAEAQFGRPVSTATSASEAKTIQTKRKGASEAEESTQPSAKKPKATSVLTQYEGLSIDEMRAINSEEIKKNLVQAGSKVSIPMLQAFFELHNLYPTELRTSNDRWQGKKKKEDWIAIFADAFGGSS